MTIVKQESDGIVFCHDDGSWFYDLHVDDLRLQGIDFWLEHMGRKNWFTPDIRAQFIGYCQKSGLKNESINF